MEYVQVHLPSADLKGNSSSCCRWLACDLGSEAVPSRAATLSACSASAEALRASTRACLLLASAVVHY